MHSRSVNIFRISSTPYGPEDKAHGAPRLLVRQRTRGRTTLARSSTLQCRVRARSIRARGQACRWGSGQSARFLDTGAREDVLCEHKLDAPLGERQLERYLEFARRRSRERGRPIRVALVTGALDGHAGHTNGTRPPRSAASDNT
jgi:hypothetical protein